MVEGVFHMKNKVKLAGIIAMVALIVFSMTACPTGDGIDDDGVEKTILITNFGDLPHEMDSNGTEFPYADLTVFKVGWTPPANLNKDDITAFDKLGELAGSRISWGTLTDDKKAIINTLHHKGDGSWPAWTGKGIFDLWIFLQEKEGGPLKKFKASFVPIVSEKTTVSFSDFKEVS
jgi:hypothetical protein